MFECAICQLTLVEPTGLPSCPHTFCNRCITKCKDNETIKCPTCRVESHICGPISPNLMLQEFINKADVPDYDLRQKEYFVDKNLNEDIIKYCCSKYCFDLFSIVLNYLDENGHSTIDNIIKHVQSKIPDRNIVIELYIILSREEVPLAIIDDKILKNDYISVTNFIKKNISNMSSNNLMNLILLLEPGIIDIDLEISPLQIKIRDYVHTEKSNIIEYLEKIRDECIAYDPVNDNKIFDMQSLADMLERVRELSLNHGEEFSSDDSDGSD